MQKAIGSNKNLNKLLIEDDAIANNESSIKNGVSKDTHLDDRIITSAFSLFRSAFTTYSFVYDLSKVKNVIDGLIINSSLPDNKKKEFLTINKSIYLGGNDEI